MRHYLTFLLAISFIAATAQTAQPDFSKVKEIINERIKDHGVPSVSIAVVKDGKIIWEEAFGYADKENKRPATTNTAYYLASISKTITATAVMKLQEQRKLNIDDPINKYLKRVKLSSTRWDPNEAKVRWVMSHESGLTSFDSWCRTDSLSCAMNDDVYIGRYAIIVRKPGTGFDYSNLGYGILDRMIRDVSGMSFNDYLKKEIFEPLGMKNSFVATDPLPPGHAVRYVGDTRWEKPFSHLYAAGASSVFSSAHDLALFAMLHLNDLKGKKKIIPETSVEKMRDTLASGTNEYGLGWWIKKDFHGYRSFLAQGGNFFSSAWLQIIPSEDMAVIVLTNVGHGQPWQRIIEETYSAVLPKFKADLQSPKEKPAEKIAVTGPAFPASRWKGTLRTYKGDVPVVFSYEGGTSGTVDVGDLKNIAVQKMEAESKFIAFKVDADLHLEDVGGTAYLNFYLRLEDENSLVGSMETRASSRPDTPVLPFSVELSRVKQ